jgi:hypothetical protein
MIFKVLPHWGHCSILIVNTRMPPGPADAGWRRVMGRVAVIVCGVIGVDRPARNDLGTQLGVGREHAMEANAAGVGATGTLLANPGMDALNEMEPWARDECGQALHEFQRRHHDMRGTISIGVFSASTTCPARLSVSRSVLRSLQRYVPVSGLSLATAGGRQPPLAPRRRRLLHPVVCGVEERLQLGPCQRTTLGTALIVSDMRCGVVLVTYLDRPRTDPLLALGDAAVARITDIGQEHGQGTLIGPDRRMRPTHLSRPSTSEPLSRRLDCWRRQPSSIASNNAGSGRSGVAPSTSTSAADPAARRSATRHLHRHPCTECNGLDTQCNRFGCLIVAAAATTDVQPQVKQRVAARSPPARENVADLKPQLHGIHTRRRMMRSGRCNSAHLHRGGMGVPQRMRSGIRRA